MRLIYLAHPFGGDLANLFRAKAWLRWAALIALESGDFVVAPWIPLCEIFAGQDAHSPDFRALMLNGDCEVVQRCDELWLCGSHVSEGMAQERDAASWQGKVVRDFTGKVMPPEYP